MRREDERAELAQRSELALKMGGADQIRRQHEHGKLTARERVGMLADNGSFREFGLLAGTGHYEDHRLTGFTPKNEVTGFVRLAGRQAVVVAGDFTIRGGSGGRNSGGMGQELSATRRALEWRVPYIRLLDAAGGSVAAFADMGRTYLPDGNAWAIYDVQLLQTVPVAAAVLGSVAGLPAINACLAHFNVMVRGTAQLFPGGPPVVKAALGLDISKEELGGSQVHTQRNGVVDNVALDEEDALSQIRSFLSYLPSSVTEMPPRADPVEPAVAAERLRAVVPESPRRPFDVYEILGAALDKDSFFEIGPDYGKSRVTGLGRVNGFPIGVMANNPRHLGGATDVAAGTKAMRLIQLCDLFHLPLVTFADEPGFAVGPESERQGYRAGRRQPGLDDLLEQDAVADLRHIPAVRRSRPVPAPADRHVSPLRLAVGPVGFDAHRWRGGSGLPAGHRSRRRPGGQTQGDRGRARCPGLSIPDRRGNRTGHHRSCSDS